jgi:hypothetical protein
MNQKLRFFLCALPALAGFADAQIDSGCGEAAVGSLTNHSSISYMVATAQAPLGLLTLRNGSIEILYATAALSPDSLKPPGDEGMAPQGSLRQAGRPAGGAAEEAQRLLELLRGDRQFVDDREVSAGGVPSAPQMVEPQLPAAIDDVGAVRPPPARLGPSAAPLGGVVADGRVASKHLKCMMKTNNKPGPGVALAARPPRSQVR